MKKITIDKQIEEHQRGIYGIFIISCNGDNLEQCVYIGKSEELSIRTKKHYNTIKNKTCILSLKDAMDDTGKRIKIRLIESVPYIFDNYFKDAQRLASRENYWIDKFQKVNQCLEQVPEGRRPNIYSWKQLKLKSNN